MSSKSYLSCRWIEYGLVFQFSQIDVCCELFSTPEEGLKGAPQIMPFTQGMPDFEKIKSFKDDLRRRNQLSGPTPCKGCPGLQLKEWEPLEHEYSILAIGNFHACNLKCNYCELGDSLEKKPLYWLYSIVETMFKDKRLAPAPNIGWGGGEPTISKEFEPLMNLLISHDAVMNLYSNCTVYSESVAAALAKNKITNLICSIDAGTDEKYLQMKGRDYSARVWDNLRRYVEAAENKSVIKAKYIVTEFNSTQEEIVAFVERCKLAGIRIIVISKDFTKSAVIPDNIIDAMSWIIINAIEKDIRYHFASALISAFEIVRVCSAALEKLRARNPQLNGYFFSRMTKALRILLEEIKARDKLLAQRPLPSS